MAKKAVVARRRRSEEQWRTLIDEQARSGRSQRAFCEARGVPLSSFSNARRRYANNAALAPVSDFVPVVMSSSGRSAWEIELALGDDVTLRLRRS